LNVIRWRQATRHNWQGQVLGVDRFLVAKQIGGFNVKEFTVFTLSIHGGVVRVPMTPDFATLQEAQDAAEGMLPELVRLAALSPLL